VQQELKDLRVRRDRPALRVQLDRLVRKVPLGNKVPPDQQELRALLELRDRKVQQDRSGLQDRKERQVLPVRLVHRVRLVLPVRLVPEELQDRLAQRVHKDHRV
jgi:hypothetical protein